MQKKFYKWDKREVYRRCKAKGWQIVGGYLHQYGMPAGASSLKRAWLYKLGMKV